MAATLRELRGRIRSAGSIKKITKAQELIATSRIARPRPGSKRPYAAEITNMLTNLAAESALDHPLLVERKNPKRAGVLVVSSDRGLCGAYNANVLRRSRGALRCCVRRARTRPLRGRPKGAGLLQLPQLEDHRVVDRLSPSSPPTRTPRDRRDPGRGVPRRCRRHRRRSRSGQHPRVDGCTSCSPSSSRCSPRPPRRAGSRRWWWSTSGRTPTATAVPL